MAGSPEDSNVQGDLDINLAGGDIRIDGVDPVNTTVDIDTTVTFDRLITAFRVPAGVGTLTLADLRLDKGQVNGTSSTGGNVLGGPGISLVLLNARVSNGNAINSAGGGISAAGPLTLTSVEMDGNQAQSYGSNATGSAILAQGALIINDSDIHGNTGTVTTSALQPSLDNTEIRGGAISVGVGGSLSMNRSTVRNNPLDSTNNTTRIPRGAGIYLREANATITDSTINGNTTIAGTNPVGAGISFNDTTTGGPADNTLTVQNSTIYNNALGTPTAGSSTGGGLEAEGGITRLWHVTFAQNGANLGSALGWIPRPHPERRIRDDARLALPRERQQQQAPRREESC